MRQIKLDRAGVVIRRLSLVLSLAIATVAAAQVPSHPAGLEATGLDQAVELRWLDANNASIVRHEMRYAAEGGEFTAWLPLGAGDTSTTIAALVNFVSYTFHLRAVNAAGVGPAAEVTATPFTMNIDLEPSFEGRSIEPICYRVGVEVWQRLPHAFAAYHYSVSPALPAGLSFNSESAVISGTPTTVQPVTTYTYTGSDFDGDEDSLEFTIKVDPNSLPTFGDAMVESQRFRVDSPVDLTLPAAMEGNGAITYRLTPALPGGLSFDANVRTISGTPNEVSPATVFTYTASDEDDDTAMLTFSIEVEADRMPDFGTATIDAQRYRVGSPVSERLPAARGGDSPITYGLSPALPDGLSFDANTRTISGTPNATLSSTVYTYTASDEDDDTATLTFAIEVEADRMPDFGTATIDAQRYRVGSPVSERLPAARGGDSPITYGLSPALPDGLSFDANTRTISGTPNATLSSTVFTYAASDEDGDTATLTFAIEVEADKMPDFGTAAIDGQRYRVGSPVNSTLPAAMGGDGAIVYGLTPALPDGLSFDANTRTISGTPNATLSSTVFTYAASDEDGDTATLTFAIEVEADSMPDFGTATVEAQRFRVGSPVAERLPDARGGDGTIVYTLSPTLPDGIGFNAERRVLNGTPTRPTARSQYVYTATDEDGDTATLPLEIEVEPDQMPTFGNATVPAQSYHVSTAIIDLVLPSAQGGDGALTYALSPALPGGLVFNAGTRTVSGVPTAQMGSTEYAFTATDEDGDTATLTFPVEVGMAIRVAVADAAELEGQDISFVVTLSDSVPVPVTVAYATSDGTAVAGEDYAATAGTLTFPAGNTEMAIVVPVTADPRPEHDEQFTLALSELVNAEFADAQATGTIIDDDTERVRGEAMEHSLSVFGRAFAADAVDAISGRFQEGPPVATPLTFAGNALPAESQGLAAGAAFGVFNDGDERRHGADVASFGGRVPAGAGFALPFGTGAENRSQWTLWGRGSTNRVSSQPDGMQVEGDINTGYLGIDARLPRNTLVGLAVARSAADFEYRQAGITEGDVSLDMTTLLPYVHWTLCDGLDLWALAGSGQGEATLMDDLGRTDTDIDLRMAAFGLRSELAERQNLVWSLKADAFMAALTADAVAEALAAADADVQRLRLLIEGRREWQRSEQSLLAGTVEFGARLDNGDADNGLGAEIGAVLDYRNLPAGIGFEARGRYLLAHAESAFDDWSLSVAMEFDPGIQGTGASLRLAPTWGTPAGDLAGVWRAERMFGTDMRAQRLGVGHRMEMEIGYGFHAKRAGALEVFGALTGSSAAPTYRIGGRRALAKGLGWSVEVDRLQRFGSDVDYGVLLTIGNTTHLSASSMQTSGAQGGMPRL